MVVIIIVIVMEKPYAASMWVELRKYKIIMTQPIQSIALTLGIYICPFKLEGCRTLTRAPYFPQQVLVRQYFSFMLCQEAE